MNNTYNLEEVFKRIEDDLVNKIINGIKKTSPESVLKEDNITVWRAGQLKALQEFKKNNKKYFTKQNKKELYKQIEDVLNETYKTAGSAQQKKILDAVKKGLKTKEVDEGITASFNGLNDRKLNAFMKETQRNLYKAETSAVRYAEDQYSKIIFDSQVYFNTGNGTLIDCIDMATKDFLSAGLNCIEYKNGRRVNIQSYSEMALRTAEKRAYVQGEAAMRDEYGLGLVIVNRRGNACPKCMQFVGKIYNDDVFGNVPINPKYPLLSEAIAGGLYHPNCKDVHTTYFPGITTEYKTPTKQEILNAENKYQVEQQQRYNERQIRKYKRLADGTLNEEEQKQYADKVKKWQAKQRQLINDNPELKRDYWRESVVADVKPSEAIIPEPVKFITFENTKEIESFFKNDKDYIDWAAKTREDKTLGGFNSFEIYSSSKYRIINNGLRGKIAKEAVVERLPGYDEIIESIDKHIERYNLKENITVFRGVQPNAFGSKKLKDLKKMVGKIFEEKAYSSTSLIKEKSFNKKIKMEINVPKGKGRGAYINDFSIYKNENEFLIARDSKFLIKSVSDPDEDGVILIKADLIPLK